VDARYFAFRGRDLLVRRDGNRLVVPDEAEWTALGLEAVRMNELAVAGTPAYAVELAAAAEPPAGMSFENLRRVHFAADEATVKLASRAVQIVEWDRSNQFCGRDTTPMERFAVELAKRCPRCHNVVYPRLSPAVIVLVERGDECLLGRNARFPLPMYSTLAGFVEVGETIEEAVHREIREEAGIEVTGLRYFGSQSWPFPDSLMIGFHAVYAGGELRVDSSELVDAAWFRVDDLPMVSPRISIARRLIDDWVRRHGGDPDALKSIT
jgi:NAD+ diphosphatase